MARLPHGAPALRVLEGVVLLPWAAGQAIWQAWWALWLRPLLIVGVGWAMLYAFFPWRTR